MHLLFSKHLDVGDQGQITVFLALVFLVITGLIFCTLEGVREYETSALAEDALEGAGKDVLANYDKPLFIRYDLFFLDPREKEWIREDGKEYIDRYFTEGEFFGMNCPSMSVDQYISATDQSGDPLKEEIHEWAQSRVSQDDDNDGGSNHGGDEGYNEDMVRRINEEYLQRYPAVAGYVSEIRKVSGDEILKKTEEVLLPDSSVSEDDNDPSDLTLPPVREVNAWKEIQETLDGINEVNIEESLYNVAGMKEGTSGRTLDTRELPSAETGFGPDQEEAKPLKNFRYNSVGTLTDYFPSESSYKDEDSSEEEQELLIYIRNHFYAYAAGAEKVKGALSNNKNHCDSVQVDVTVLRYEREYLISGMPDDESNLKHMMRRIFRWRFLTNYDYAYHTEDVAGKAEEIASSLAGYEGFYSDEEAGKVLLIGAAAYGQTLMDVADLLRGDPVPLIPDHESWKADLYHYSKLNEYLGEPGKGRGEVYYEDYLNMYLSHIAEEKVIRFRMMDLMQSNIRLSEPGFRMKEALYSFRWKGVIKSRKWFPVLVGYGLNSSGLLSMKFQKVYSY